MNNNKVSKQHPKKMMGITTPLTSKQSLLEPGNQSESEKSINNIRVNHTTKTEFKPKGQNFSIKKDSEKGKEASHNPTFATHQDKNTQCPEEDKLASDNASLPPTPAPATHQDKNTQCPEEDKVASDNASLPPTPAPATHQDKNTQCTEEDEEASEDVYLTPIPAAGTHQFSNMQDTKNMCPDLKREEAGINTNSSETEEYDSSDIYHTIGGVGADNLLLDGITTNHPNQHSNSETEKNPLLPKRPASQKNDDSPPPLPKRTSSQKQNTGMGIYVNLEKPETPLLLPTRSSPNEKKRNLLWLYLKEKFKNILFILKEKFNCLICKKSPKKEKTFAKI